MNEIEINNALCKIKNLYVNAIKSYGRLYLYWAARNISRRRRAERV